MPLAITSAGEPQLGFSQAVASDAEGIIPSGDHPLDVDLTDPGASAGASA